MNSGAGAVLIVEDDRAIRQVLHTPLLHAGFKVAEARSVKDALKCMRSGVFDAVLLEMLLPGMDGMEICRVAQKDHPRLPIIVVTRQDNEDRIVEALEAGADDYVVKPFNIRELMARLRAIIRRKRLPEENTEAVISIGEIILDPSRQEVRKNGRRIHLTPKEFGLLHQLMLHAGNTVSHSRLLESVWGPDFGGEVEYLRTFVRKLRIKIEDNPALPRYLLSDLAYGYLFVDAAQSECGFDART